MDANYRMSVRVIRVSKTKNKFAVIDGFKEIIKVLGSKRIAHLLLMGIARNYFP